MIFRIQNQENISDFGIEQVKQPKIPDMYDDTLVAPSYLAKLEYRQEKQPEKPSENNPFDYLEKFDYLPSKKPISQILPNRSNGIKLGKDSCIFFLYKMMI